MANFMRFEAIKAPRFDDSAARFFLTSTMMEYGQDAVTEFNKTTSYWKARRPKFSVKPSGQGRGKNISVEVYTDSLLYLYLDKGVEGHDIIPRKAQKSGTTGTYIAGSNPGTISVNPSGGYKIADGWYLSLNWVVPWPGIEAREFSRLIKEKLEKNPSTSLFGRIKKTFLQLARRLWRK